MHSKKIFKNYMTLMGEIFNKDLSPTLMTLYWDVMKDYSDKQAEDMFKLATTSLKFFPKPAELKELACNYSDLDDLPALAWSEVDNAVRTIGNYQSVEFNDPVCHSVIQAMGGWSELCQCSNDEWKWKRVEFEKLYPTMKKKGNHDQYLLGDCEQSQRLNDREDWIKPVAKAGDKKNTKLLTEGE